MVNAGMFSGTSAQLQTLLASGQLNNSAPVAPRAPVPTRTADPDIEKIRKWLLLALSIAVGGGAILLIIWRVILKFI